MIREADELRTVEVTEIELTRLRLAARRFDWFIRFFSASFGEPVGDVLDKIDRGLVDPYPPETIGRTVAGAARKRSTHRGGYRRK